MKKIDATLAKTLIAAAVSMSSAGFVHAATINQTTTPGSIYTTLGVDSSVSGGDMAGMRVTATWVQDNNSQSGSGPQTWVDTSFLWVNRGGVTLVNNPIFQRDFRVSVTGSTSTTNAWDLNFNVTGGNFGLVSLTFDGREGNTVFDICGVNNAFCGSNGGTTGSGTGLNFAGFGSFGGTINANYSNAVARGNAAPVGDLFTTLTLNFGNGTYASALGEGSYSFTADTDQASLVARAQQVPEPATVALLGLGLLGVAASRRQARGKRA